jgi:CHAD domain-containing protein
VFPEEITERFKADFAHIGRLSSQLRDLDVYLLNEHRYRAMLPASLASDIEPLFELLRQKRAEALGDIINGLNSEKYLTTRRAWEMFLNEPSPGSSPNAGRPIIDLARERIYKAYRRIVKYGVGVLEDSEEIRLHTLRINCKQLRYLMEFFASLFPDKELLFLIEQLKQLQDHLGEFNDLRVQQEYLSSLAPALPEEARQAYRPILAMGSLIGAMEAEKHRVKKTLAQTFTSFIAPANQEFVKALFYLPKKEAAP